MNLSGKNREKANTGFTNRKKMLSFQFHYDLFVKQEQSTALFLKERHKVMFALANVE